MVTTASLRPIGRALGTEVLGLDLSQALDDATIQWIEDALAAHPVLVFRDQQLDPADIARFGKRFGRPRPHALTQYRHPEVADVSYIRNVDDDGNIDSFGVVRATSWHTDATYEDRLPRMTILHALEVPAEKGGTLFADMRAAYDALPDPMKARIAALTGLHGHTTGPAGGYYAGHLDPEQESTYTEQRHPAVMEHPSSGRRILFVNPVHTHGFASMDRDQALELVRELTAHAVQDRFVYYHQWRVGDLVMWDDLATMHRGAGDSAPEERRVMLRTIVYPN